MICPNCEQELEAGKLYCAHCGYEINIVPNFEPEIENSIQQTLSILADEVSGEQDDFEVSMQKPDYITTVLKTITNLKYYRYILGGIVFLLAILIVVSSIMLYREKSYGYQIYKADKFAKIEKYDLAIPYLEKAVKIDPQNDVNILLLADYYCRLGQEENAMYVLQNIMASYPVSEDIYRKLISLLEERNDFVGISQLLEDCNDEVKNTFQKYLASPPEFSMTEGTYYEIVPLKLLSSTTGDIYYTLDGKKPDLTSSLYTSPIFLDAGKYTVSAIFVNDYGVISDSVTRQYYIDVTKPVGPEINLYSGDYDLPEMIMASSLNEEETIYYTLDGTEPSIDSFRYFGPIPMPLGESTFKFITCTEDGVYSDIIERVYRLNIKYHISPEDAILKTIVALNERGLLLDLQGHVPELTGNYTYQCTNAVTYGSQPYYLIVEQYQDGNGTLFDSGNRYAVNAYTGELCRAILSAYGTYTIVVF